MCCLLLPLSLLCNILFVHQFGIARYVLLILVCSFCFLGYRHIHLLGNKGDSLGYASLFVHINIRGGAKRDKSSDRSSLSVRFQFVADTAVYQDIDFTAINRCLRGKPAPTQPFAFLSLPLSYENRARMSGSKSSLSINGRPKD